MADITLNILKPSVNNLSTRIFVRAAGLDFEEVDVWGATTGPEYLGKYPAHLTPTIEAAGLPRGTLGESCAIMAYLCNVHGLDRFYPAGHEQLLRAVTRSGAVLSETPPGCAPTRWRFLARNRLIAALARGTVVVEAAWRSGALSTAHHAAELGRPVGAVPRPVTSMASAGCHRLVRDRRAGVSALSARMIRNACTVSSLSASSFRSARHAAFQSRFADVP